MAKKKTAASKNELKITGFFKSASGLVPSDLTSPAPRTTTTTNSGGSSTLPPPAIDSVAIASKHSLPPNNENNDVNNAVISRPSKRARSAPGPGFAELQLIFDKIKNEERYQPYWATYTIDYTYERLWSYTRAPVKRIIIKNEGWQDLKTLKSIGGNLYYKGPAWYLDAMGDSSDPDFIKEYVGQADDLDYRLGSHALSAKDLENRSLHYLILRAKPTRSSTYVVLGEYPTYERLADIEMEQIFKNIGEQ
ncbi:hypothetical protein C1H76_3380 [Elsinoe australis]|uniref:Uncharacterized protein n=1 Tax=Elsinoe australis TaxID=40998 RepID=A0A4U7AZQ2_9PEZI|nr:hypothetical protein C1H76_3380 [Elsinoe australis]